MSPRRGGLSCFVWSGTGILVVHCHDVRYQGSFAVFWVVEKGLRKTIWSTNKPVDIREVENSPQMDYPFGVYTYPQWQVFLAASAYT